MFSTVWRAWDTETDTEVAVRISRVRKNGARDDYNNTVNALSVLDHPNMLTLISSFKTTYCFYVVTNLVCNAVPLSNYISMNEGAISMCECKVVIPQVLSAVKHMHENGFAHRDIKPDNILINIDTLDITLIDFGFACKTSKKMRRSLGTPYYMSPTVLISAEYLPNTSDAWSTGCTLYEIIYGSVPFEASTLPELKKKVIRGEYNMDSVLVNGDVLPDTVRDVIKGLLDKRDSKRMTLSDACCQIEDW